MSIPRISYTEQEYYDIGKRFFKLCNDYSISYRKVLKALQFEHEIGGDIFKDMKDILDDEETALSKLILILLKK